MDIGDVIKVVEEMVMDDGTIAQNVFYYILQGSSSVDDAAIMLAIGAQLDDLYENLETYIADTLSLNPRLFNIVSWHSDTQKWETDRYVGSSVPTWTPSNVNDQLPNQIAAILTATTLIPKSRGRKFIPGFSDTVDTSGILSGAALTALAAAAADYIASLSVGAAETLKPCVASTTQGTALTFRASEAQSILGTQRRRKPGVGV